MVAMCLVKDQTKRPSVDKLLKHSFFKQAKPPELSVKKLFADLPPLWTRVKALQVWFHAFFSACSVISLVMLHLHDFSTILQLKDAAQLALKRMPSAEQEAISQVKSWYPIFICHKLWCIVFRIQWILLAFLYMGQYRLSLSFYFSFSWY